MPHRPAGMALTMLLLALVAPSGCGGRPTDAAPGEADAVRAALAGRVGDYEELARRSGGLPTILFLGRTRPDGVIEDLPDDALAGFRSEVFAIRPASRAKLQSDGKVPLDFLVDRESGERGIRILVSRVDQGDDGAVVETLNGMSSFEGQGTAFRSTLAREGAGYRVVKTERTGGLP